MTYKGYTARVSYDPEDRLLLGEVLGLPDDTIVFDAEDVETLEKRFQDSIEAYLEDCVRTGREPVKPYSGRILLRMPPEIHAELARIGAGRGMSLNAVISEILARETEKARKSGAAA